MEGPMTVSLVGLRCRTSDRTPAAARGVEELAPLVGERLGIEPRLIGTPGDPRDTGFDEDLRDSRGCLLEAGGQVDDALSGGNFPLLLAGDCSIALTTLQKALAHRPEARVLWLDAHGDFNTPETSPSGFLGGHVPGGRLRQVGDAASPSRSQRSAWCSRACATSTPASASCSRRARPRSWAPAASRRWWRLATRSRARRVYVHLDLDVIDPESFPAQFPAPGGLAPDKLFDLLEAVTEDCELVGLEVTAFEAQENEAERRDAAATALHVMEPLLQAIPEEAHVGN